MLYDGIPDVFKMELIQADGHPTAEGYAIIAEDIFRFLTESGIIRCG
jgi:lysophospholipase L1-like esterase